jgi:hypothetical protein
VILVPACCEKALSKSATYVEPDTAYLYTSSNGLKSLLYIIHFEIIVSNQCIAIALSRYLQAPKHHLDIALLPVRTYPQLSLALALTNKLSWGQMLPAVDYWCTLLVSFLFL